MSKACRYLFLMVGLFCISACSLLFKSTGGNKLLISAPDAPPAQLITAIPFQQLTGGVILIHAKINVYPDTLNFILDTGSGGISLDSATSKRLGLKVEPSNLFVRGIGGIRKMSFAYNNTLVLPNLKVDSLDFHINDYEFISSVYGLKIDGIVGYSFIKRFIIHIDYDQKKILIYSPGRYQYAEGGFLLHPDIHNIPVIPARIKNKAAPIHTRYYFDIGAGLCFMVSNKFVKDSCLYCKRKQRRHRFIKTEAQGFVGAMTMTETVMGHIHIGPYSFRNVPTYLFDDLSNVTAYPLLGGLIGNDLLRRFNTTLNYAQKEIYLKPNGQFKDGFDYSYTGLTLYFIDGKVVVTKVIKGSPGDKARFKDGDVIVAVDGNFSNNIRVYHKLLKGVGETVQVIIVRKGVLNKMKLKVRSIL